MARSTRKTAGGLVYHVLNRGVSRMELFSDTEDYQCFLSLLTDMVCKYEMRVCALAVMPNHWHLALWPSRDDELSSFMRVLTTTHVRRWQKRWCVENCGHLYQGRYKSFPVENESYYLKLIHYIEQNPVKANLVVRAQDWRWSSAWIRQNGTLEQKNMLSEGPVKLPESWSLQVNRALHVDDVNLIRQCIERGRPLGREDWASEIAIILNLESTMKPFGRPKNRDR